MSSGVEARRAWHYEEMPLDGRQKSSVLRMSPIVVTQSRCPKKMHEAAFGCGGMQAMRKIKAMRII
jgi:hypothetical protein